MISLNLPELPYLFFPLWALLIGFISCLLFWKSTRAQQWVAIISGVLYLIAAVLLLISVSQNDILVTQVGNWPAPFGISIVADLLAAIMVLISAVIGLCVILYATGDITAKQKKKGFYPVLLIMLFGVCGSFLTGDVFNLYVWFEIMLVASFVLMIIGNKKAQLEGAVKYVILSFISSGFLLMGIGILYKLTGSLNMAELADILPEHPNQTYLTLSAVFFFMGFGIKAALFPLFSWLPASYPTPATSAVALMAGLLTKVGVYALIRFATLLYTYDLSLIHGFLMVISGLTMFFGVLGAVAQNELRKILSFHIVSQIGYMVMGLAIYTPLAIAGSIFYMVHHILVKTNLFLISGVVRKISGTYLLDKLGGYYNKYPFITVLFIVSAFSLAGLPPLSGFWGKFMLAQAGLQMGYYFIVAVSLLVGLLTLFSMTKIWKSVFWSPVNERKIKETMIGESQFIRANYILIIPPVLLVLCTLILSFNPDSLISLAQRTAEQLLDPQVYIDKVLINR